MKLLQGKKLTIYHISSIHLPKEQVEYLSKLGIVNGNNVSILSESKDTFLLMLASNRIAIDKEIAKDIEIVSFDDEKTDFPLSELNEGEIAYIKSIFAPVNIKRHLLDMGLTKYTKVFLKRKAPLGNPIEITIRVFELTLRKSEAMMISVYQKEESK